MAEENEAEKLCILEARKRFFDENAKNLTDYDEKDLKRLQHDDLWVRCFVRTRGQNLSKVVEAMNICLRWRKTFDINEMTERQIDRRLFEAGFLFPHNRDKEGNSIIIFTGKNHKKDPQQHAELKRFLVFLLEKHARMYPSKKITLIFDMQETGLANMDMDFVKFIVTCFTNYFPNTLAWLLVVELPWILSAAWKIVKTWLSPEATNKIKFISKPDLTEYVDEDKLLERLGGKDAYEYCYPQSKDDIGYGPPERDGDSLDALKPSIDINTAMNGEEKKDFSPQLSFEETETPKTTKVKFDEENLAYNASANNSALDNQGNKDDHPASVKSSLKSHSPKHPKSTPVEEKTPATKFLNITPMDELVFGGTPNATGEILQTLTLDNNCSCNVAFKVKTTSPESYRVRPSAGVISPNSFTDVSVYLQPGHTSNVFRDKFLVMSTEISEGMTPAEIAIVWKSSAKSSILEHRLRCSIVSTISPSSESQHSETDANTSVIKTSELTEQLKSMERKIDRVEKKICYIEEGLQLFIKVQLGLFSGMIVLFAVGFYYATLLIQ